MEATVTRRRFTADEYERMGEAGILHEDEHVELIEGDILQMAAIGGRHIACVNRCTDVLTRLLAGEVIVSIQNSIRLSPSSEPEPDVAVLRRRADFYADAPPPADAVLLIIEVADTSLGYDRDVKLPLYAAAGIPEVWIADVASERTTVYREPAGNTYQASTTYERGQTITPLAFPDIRITVDELFGPRDE